MCNSILLDVAQCAKSKYSIWRPAIAIPRKYICFPSLWKSYLKYVSSLLFWPKLHKATYIHKGNWPLKSDRTWINCYFSNSSSADFLLRAADWKAWITYCLIKEATSLWNTALSDWIVNCIGLILLTWISHLTLTTDHKQC